MPTENRHSLQYVCASFIVLIFPTAVLFPPVVALFVLGMVAIYYLCFARALLLLAISAVLALAIIWLYGGIERGVLFMIGMAIPGLTTSLLRKQGFTVAAAVAGGALLPVAGIAVKYRTLVSMIQLLSSELKNLAASPQLAQSYSPREYSLFVDFVSKVADKLIYFYPSLILLFIVTALFAGVAMGNYLVRQSGIFALEIDDFTRWKLPEWMIVPLGVAVIFVLTNQEVLAIIGWNVLLFLFVVYSVFGLSFLEYQMRTRRFPLPVKIVIYLFLFLTQVVAAVLLPLVALFDSKFDFRKIRAKQLG